MDVVEVEVGPLEVRVWVEGCRQEARRLLHRETRNRRRQSLKGSL